MSKTRTVTVTFEGTDFSGEEFTFTRTVRADKSSDNPIFYGKQAAEAAKSATDSVRKSVEGLYGGPPEARGAGSSRSDSKMYVITNAAMYAANAIAWPNEDDREAEIADEDDLRKVIEAAAPHIALSTLTIERDRLRRQIAALDDLRAQRETGSREESRLSGKLEGVKITESNIEETIRTLQLVIAHPALAAHKP